MAHNTAHEIVNGEHAHPSSRQYVVIAVILAIITAAEVAVVFVPALASVLFYILLVLSLAKFVLVVMYYMHLKFDSRIFTTVFVAPLTLAVGMVVALYFLFQVLPYV